MVIKHSLFSPFSGSCSMGGGKMDDQSTMLPSGWRNDNGTRRALSSGVR